MVSKFHKDAKICFRFQICWNCISCILNCYLRVGSITFKLKSIIPYSLFNIKTLFLLNEVAIVYNELGHFHQQTWIVLKLLEARRGRHLLEIFDKIAYAEFLQLGTLILVWVNQELNYIIIIYILHECVFAKVLESIQDVGVGEPKQVKGNFMIEILDAACV